MSRLARGLIFGGCAFAIAWAAGAALWLAFVIGAVVACLVWFGKRVLDALEDFVEWLTTH